MDRAKADTASIRTVQGQMQQDISGNLSRIQTEEINRATAVSALSNRSDTIEASVRGVINTSFNEYFDNDTAGWSNIPRGMVVASSYGRANVLRTVQGVRYNQVEGRKVYITSADQKFRLRVSWRCALGSGRYFFGAVFYDAAGNVVAANDGIGNYPLGPNVLSDSVLNNGWNDREVVIGKGMSFYSQYGGSCEIPASTVYFRPVMFLNYENNPDNITEVDYFVVEDTTQSEISKALISNEATTRADMD
ncbi:hypothetical protein, partial [Parvimonas sp. M20]